MYNMERIFTNSHSSLDSSNILSTTGPSAAAILNSTTSHDVISNCSSDAVTCEMTSRDNESTTIRTIMSDEPWRVALIVIGCGVIILGTIVGNLLVCTAVCLVRKLRTPSNLLIVSLATSDLLVACLVMPLAALYDVQNRWTLGRLLCDIWTSLDVMLCTASILNLCAISVDRYLIITRPLRYALKRTKLHMMCMIAIVWVTSALISIPPLFGWKDVGTGGRKPPSNIDQCVLSQAVGYQFYATIGAFYLPLVVMLIIYTRIYLVSSRIARSEERSRPSASIFFRRRSRLETSNSGLSRDQVIPGTNLERQAMLGRVDSNGTGTQNGLYHSDSSRNGQIRLVNGQKKVDGKKGKILKLLLPCCVCCFTSYSTNHDESCCCSATPFLRSSSSSNSSPGGVGRSLKTSPSSSIPPLPPKRERKATKTLGIIMGAFIACWLPFFVAALVRPFVMDIPHIVTSFLQWLGYANSFLNPIIYARFNRDFRGPFKDIVTCKCRGINSRQRSETYAEQFGAYDALRHGLSNGEIREARAAKSGSLSAVEQHINSTIDSRFRKSAPELLKLGLKPSDSTVV